MVSSVLYFGFSTSTCSWPLDLHFKDAHTFDLANSLGVLGTAKTRAVSFRGEGTADSGTGREALALEVGLRAFDEELREVSFLGVSGIWQQPIYLKGWWKRLSSI